MSRRLRQNIVRRFGEYHFTKKLSAGAGWRTIAFSSSIRQPPQVMMVGAQVNAQFHLLSPLVMSGAPRHHHAPRCDYVKSPPTRRLFAPTGASALRIVGTLQRLQEALMISARTASSGTYVRAREGSSSPRSFRREIVGDPLAAGGRAPLRMPPAATLQQILKT